MRFYMHKVIAAYLKQFVKENELESLAENEQFERFFNYCQIKKYYPDEFDVDDVTTGVDDESIDGACVMIADHLVTTREGAQRIFKNAKSRQNLDVTYVFMQAKTSEGFDAGDMLKFAHGVERVFSAQAESLSDYLLQELSNIKSEVVDNLAKVENGRPDCVMYYATTGVWSEKSGLSKIKKEAERLILGTGLFNKAEFVPVDREGLIKLWNQTKSPVSASFNAEGILPFPTIANVEESYLILVKAKEFVEKVLSDDEGRIQASVFEQNVRAFLGDENPVNASILATLSSSAYHDKFLLLNNGLTIVSSDVRVQGTRVSISDYQIVNGCQTSHVLFRNQKLVSDYVKIPLKVIEADDPDILGRVVEATNSQSEVSRSQFLSIRPFVQKIEQYFGAVEDSKEFDCRLYFERRTKQYAGEDISNLRIFDIQKLARVYCAMFLNVPHLASRYPTQAFEEMADKIYQEGQREYAYYIAALSHYRLALSLANNYVPQEYTRYKWHILMLLNFILGEGKVPDLKNKRLDKHCDKIFNAIKMGGKASAEPFLRATKIIDKVGLATPDKLKRQAYTHELLAELGVKAGGSSED